MTGEGQSRDKAIAPAIVAHACSTRAAPRGAEVRRSRVSSSSVSRSPAVTGAAEGSGMRR